MWKESGFQLTGVENRTWGGTSRSRDERMLPIQSQRPLFKNHLSSDVAGSGREQEIIARLVQQIDMDMIELEAGFCEVYDRLQQFCGIQQGRSTGTHLGNRIHFAGTLCKFL